MFGTQRCNHHQGATSSFRDAVINANNSLVYGRFDNVDIHVQKPTTTSCETDFTHLTLEGTHEASDAVRLRGLVSYSEAKHDNPVLTTLLFDRADVEAHVYDFRGNDRLPVIILR